LEAPEAAVEAGFCTHVPLISTHVELMWDSC